MLDHVVLDVEIAKCIGEDGIGWNDTDRVGIACACLWEYQTRRMRIYGSEDTEALQERLLKADRITGYNIWKFDFPVIWGVPASAWCGEMPDHPKAWTPRHLLKQKCDDLLRRICKAIGVNPDTFNPRQHGGYGLAAVASHNLRKSKIGNGADAPRWFQAGQWAKVVNYCADDVALERDLCDYLERYGGIHDPKDPSRGFIPVPPWDRINEKEERAKT